jgi:prevent-host-death family protein
MLKTSASRFKTNLGKFMRAVRAGQEVVVTDRDEPVARLVPFRAQAANKGLVISRQAEGNTRFDRVKLASIRYRGTSTTQLLRDDRDRR